MSIDTHFHRTQNDEQAKDDVENGTSGGFPVFYEALHKHSSNIKNIREGNSRENARILSYIYISNTLFIHQALI